VQRLSDEQQEAEQIMDNFVSKFKSLPLDKLSPEEAFAELQKLKSQVDVKKNNFLAQILSNR